MRNLHWRGLAAAAALALSATAGMAQTAPLPTRDIVMQMDSGPLTNMGGPGVDPLAPAPVYFNQVHVPNVPWIRLRFDQVLLSGDPALGNGAYIQITSILDGGTQRIDANQIKDWNYTSAYFNGDTVIVEVFAHQGTGASRISMSSIWAGVADAVLGPTDTICGATDDRALSSDPRQGRLMPIGCTAWLIDRGNCANRFLTAGHCISNATTNAVVQFHVPFSSTGGGTINPPPQDQFPVPAGQINSTGDVGIGIDAAQFFTGVNSLGLHARPYMGGDAYTLAATSGAPGPTLRVTGYGVTEGGANGLPFNQSQVQKTHTGAYVSKSGTTIRYTVDTTGGNSGSPVVNEATGLAIGIHTHAGCTSTGGSNQGTAIEFATLQGFLNNPTGTCLTGPGPSCLATLMAQNNGGSPGGAIYFDAQIPSNNSVRVDQMIINTSAPLATAFTVTVYRTADTAVGKEANAGAWTQVSTGAGVSQGTNQDSYVTLNTPFTLLGGQNYGLAIVLSASAAHAYTNGDGTNETYSNSDLVIIGRSATNVPFTAPVLGPRVFNGRLCYEVLPITGQCLETLFAQNNSGSAGGAVYFNVNVAAANKITVSSMFLNTTAAAGVPYNVTVYRTPTTHVGKEGTPGAWTQIATGVGEGAGPDNPSPVTLNQWFTLEASSSQGIAIVLDAAAGHHYTNGTGSNQNYSNSHFQIVTGSATNTPFGGGAFTPRVWNGRLCYEVGVSATCPNTAVAQAPPNPTLQGRNSNIAASASTQQIADQFRIPGGASVTGVMLWAAYTGDATVPNVQDLTVRIMNDAANLPGAVIYTETASLVPLDTGTLMTGFGDQRKLYQFNVDFNPPFNAANNVQYWLSPVGTTDGKTWAWQFRGSQGDHGSRPNATAAWTLFASDLAWSLCKSASCYPDCNLDGNLNLGDFGCFQTKFALGDPYADCNGDGILNLGDFGCFQTKFALGCP